MSATYFWLAPFNLDVELGSACDDTASQLIEATYQS